MALTRRIVCFVSDGTGLTAEGLGMSLLSQFDGFEFEHYTIPYIDSVPKAKKFVERVNKFAASQGTQPIIFDTIVNREVREVLSDCNALMIDIFATFLKPLEEELGCASNHSVGKSHSIESSNNYLNRIDAINYALVNDDGVNTQNYNEADLILTGVSRSGKTPTCLYLAMQYGIKAANYPFTEEDLDSGRLPHSLRLNKKKVFGLTIDPERLSAIRSERRADSRYCSLKQCQYEVREVEALFKQSGISFLSTTDASVEEISARILSETGLRGSMSF